MGERMRVAVIGAGGHGAVVVEIARAGAVLEPVCFIDDFTALHGSRILGLPVLGPTGDLSTLPAEVSGVLLALGNNRNRAALLALAHARGLDCPVAIHSHAWVSPSAQLAAGTVVAAGAVVSARAVVGPACIINTGASVDHDCILSTAVHVAPGAHLAGGVKIGARAFIGIGASVIQGIAIGEGALVAAGAVVVCDVLPGVRVAGVPARPMDIGGQSGEWDPRR